MISGKSLISGEWLEGQGTNFSSNNPLTNKKIKDYNGVNTSQINKAVEEAHKSYYNYQAIDFDKRANFIDAIAEEIESLGDELLEICNEETGLGIPRLAGERGRTCGQLRAFANLVREGHWQQARIDTSIPDREPFPKADIRRVLMPLGPIAVFAASNFPLAFSVLGGDTASALATGNPVIVKAHPSHPGTSELCSIAIERAIKKDGLPKGIFSLLQGADPSISTDLVNHPKLKAVGFTGSTKVGRILFNIGASRAIPIPVFAEMGSSNPLFILPKALENKGSSIATGLAGSITMGTGQFCTKPGLIFTIKSKHSQKFINDLKLTIEKIQLGTMLNSGIKLSLSSKLEAFGKEENLATFTGGSVETPTLFLTTGSDFIKNPELEDEVFGPVALIIECKNLKEMIKVTSLLGGHLTGTIHTDNDPEAGTLKTILEEKVGRIIYNGFPTGVEVCPSMHHGGPYPSSTYGTATSVGTAAIERFCKVVCYQDAPQEHLPEALKNKNARGIMRLVNGRYSTKDL
jgi:NADP-dependent aldehyde dehydrogenase